MKTILTMHLQTMKSINTKLKIFLAIALPVYPIIFVGSLSILPTLNKNVGNNNGICLFYYTYTFMFMYIFLGRCFFSDPKNTFNKFISSTPINFSTALAGQYVSFLISSLFTTVYAIISLAISCKIFNISVTANHLMSFVLPVSAFLLMASINIPLTLRLGAKSSYIITIISVSFIMIFNLILVITTVRSIFMQGKLTTSLGTFSGILSGTSVVLPFLPFITGTLIYIISKKKQPMIYTN